MDLLGQLNASIRYIEENLCGEIDFEEAARIACVSRDSYLRFFSYMTGMSLSEYVRKRRMTLAAMELRESNTGILDLALKYGYESADAFARAFARQHGMKPSVFRKSECSVRIYPPASFYITIKGARKMDFRMIDLLETTVCGISKPYTGGSRETLRSEMWDEKSDNVPGQLCSGSWNEPGNHSYDGVWYGIWSGGSYLIGRQEPQIQREAPETRTLPAGHYAAFTTEPGGLAWEELPKLFDQIFNAWLPDSGYRLAGEEIIELYYLWTDKDMRKKNRRYEVWIPVSKT